MEQVLHRKACDQALYPAVGRQKVVVKTRVDPALEIAPAPFGIDVGRPCYREWVHAEFVFQHPRLVEAVLAARTGHQTVIVAVPRAISVTQHLQFPAPLFPIDIAILLLRHPTCVANTVGIKIDRLFLAVLGMLVLNRGVRALVGDHASRAERDMLGQSVKGVRTAFVQSVFRKVQLVGARI